MSDPSDPWQDERNKNKKTNSKQVPSMNIFEHAAKACRSVSRVSFASLLAPAAKASVASALNRFLETAAGVLCVHINGVMVCGASGASVAHLPDRQSPNRSPR
jgi:hypothetical protein